MGTILGMEMHVLLPPQPRRARIALILAFSLIGAACAPAPAPDTLQGRFSIKGGGAPFDVVTALTTAFSKAHPRVGWDFEDVGSKGGMAAVANGEADLGTASIPLLPNFKGQVEVLSVGASGTAIVVASSNPVKDLTRDQVRDIFSGAITDWSAVGGAPGPITLVVRAPDTAIWSNFKAYFFDPTTKLKPGAAVAGDLPETVNAVKGLSSAIGIITASSVTRNDSSIRLLSIDGVVPSQDNLTSGTYKAIRPLYLLYKPTGLTPPVQAFLDFVRSPQGQAIIAKDE